MIVSLKHFRYLKRLRSTAWQRIRLLRTAWRGILARTVSFHRMVEATSMNMQIENFNGSMWLLVVSIVLTFVCCVHSAFITEGLGYAGVIGTSPYLFVLLAPYYSYFVQDRVSAYPGNGPSQCIVCSAGATSCIPCLFNGPLGLLYLLFVAGGISNPTHTRLQRALKHQHRPTPVNCTC